MQGLGEQQHTVLGKGMGWHRRCTRSLHSSFRKGFLLKGGSSGSDSHNSFECTAFETDVGMSCLPCFSCQDAGGRDALLLSEFTMSRDGITNISSQSCFQHIAGFRFRHQWPCTCLLAWEPLYNPCCKQACAPSSNVFFTPALLTAGLGCCQPQMRMAQLRLAHA